MSAWSYSLVICLVYMGRGLYADFAEKAENRSQPAYWILPGV